MRSLGRIALCAGVIGGCLAVATAEVRAEEMSGSLGLGIALVPDYEGSSDYEAVPLPDARLNYGGMGLSLAPGLGALQLRADVVPSPNILAGPLIDYRRARKDVANNRVDDMRSIDPAIELGAFVGYRGNFTGTLPQGYQADLQFGSDVSDEHGGWLLQPGLAYWRSIGRDWRFSSRLSTTYASDGYMSTYFGVDQKDSQRSGLREYNANAGFKDVGLGLGLSYSLTQNWVIEGRGAYTRLLEDAADSPVTDDEGSANQLFGGVLINYRF